MRSSQFSPVKSPSMPNTSGPWTLEVVPGLKTADDTLVVDIAELDWSGSRKVGRDDRRRVGEPIAPIGSVAIDTPHAHMRAE